MPLTANSSRLHDAEETVTCELAADSAPLIDLLLPTRTVPKLKFEGVTVRTPPEDVGAFVGIVAPQASCIAEAANNNHKKYRARVWRLKKYSPKATLGLPEAEET